MIIVEFLRALWNRGQPSNLYFWRDSTGNEVDLLRDEAGVLHPVEIKSGQTIASDMLKGLHKWGAIARTPSSQPWLVHGGEGDYVRQEVRVLGWRETVDCLNT